MSPKISIIIPAYNEEKHISCCLDSVLNQTFTDFEAICVDDGSTDSTFEIINNYSKKDSRIIPLKNTEKGVSSARNFGIDNAKGNYIGFVDSDDFIQPQMFEFLYRAVSENDADISICNFVRTDCFNKKEYEYTVKTFDVKNIDNVLNINNFNEELLLSISCNKLIKKNLINHRFEKYKMGEDTVFSSKLWPNVNKFSFVDLPLYLYYYNDKSASSLSPNDIKWLELIETRFIAYKNYNGFNENIASVFLNNGMKILLSYRLFSENKNADEIKKIYKKNKKNYYSNKKTSFKNKLYVFISYHFPFIYKTIRKSLDKSIK